MKARGVAGVLAGAAAILAFALALSGGPNPNEVPTVNEVSKRIMSPYCEGLLVADCPSRQSAQLRSRISEKVQSKWTNREIDDWLVENYGEQVLARPRGAGSLLVPLVAITAGVGAVLLVLARWSQTAKEREEPSLTQDEHARVAADFDRYAQEATE